MKKTKETEHHAVYGVYQPDGTFVKYKPTKPDIHICHEEDDHIKCKLPSPDDEERYTYSQNDGRGDNPVKTVPYSRDGRGILPKDSPLLKGHSSGEGSTL